MTNINPSFGNNFNKNINSGLRKFNAQAKSSASQQQFNLSLNQQKSDSVSFSNKDKDGDEAINPNNSTIRFAVKKGGGFDGNGTAGKTYKISDKAKAVNGWIAWGIGLIGRGIGATMGAVLTAAQRGWFDGWMSGGNYADNCCN